MLGSLIVTVAVRPLQAVQSPEAVERHPCTRLEVSSPYAFSLTDRGFHIHGNCAIFQWKDYWDQQQQKVMTVSAEEFIRRFLQHALPPRFQRIRYYGFLANCHRAAKLSSAQLPMYLLGWRGWIRVRE
jgi:hypothetical protein